MFKCVHCSLSKSSWDLPTGIHFFKIDQNNVSLKTIWLKFHFLIIFYFDFDFDQKKSWWGGNVCIFFSLCIGWNTSPSTWSVFNVPFSTVGYQRSNWNWHFVQESVTSSPLCFLCTFLGILLNLIDWSSFESMQLQEQYVCPEMRYMAVMLKLSRWFFGRFDYW